MNGYKDLRVWQKGLDIAYTLIEITGQFPSHIRFTLGDQMQRAAISIPSNLAEGYGRNSPNELRRFAYISLGSAMELETQLILLKRLNIIEELTMINIISELDCLLRMLNRYIQTMKES